MSINCNPLYNGKYVWGRTKWTKVVPIKDWKRQEAEPLRIVPRDLWREVLDRILLVRNRRVAGLIADNLAALSWVILAVRVGS